MRLFEENLKPLVVYNPADVLMKYDMKPGAFVSIVYLADILHGESSDPIIKKDSKSKLCYNINMETDLELQQYIEELGNSRLAQLLSEFRNSPKYLAVLNRTTKNKTCKLELSTEHIIKVSWLNCNWKSAKGLAKFYNRQREAEWQLRKDYGFEDGFEDPIDAEIDPEMTTWRDKKTYNGHNIMPRTSTKRNGNVYTDATIVPGIYASLTNPDNVAIRFAYNKKASREIADYYYVNGDGTLFELNNAFINFLIYAYKKDNVDELLEPDEKEFVTKLRALLKEAPSTAELTMKCDHILFLKSTARKGNDKIPFVWINTKNVLNNYDFIAPNELNKIIADKVRKLTPEDVNGTIENINVKGKSAADLVSYDAEGRAIADPVEVRKRLGITEALKQLIEKYNVEKEKKAIYESIMSNIAKKVKRALTESEDEYQVLNEDRENELINILIELGDDYVCIKDYCIALADSEQMVCEIELSPENELIMYDEEGDPIVGTITEEEWDQIIEAVQDCLG